MRAHRCYTPVPLAFSFPARRFLLPLVGALAATALCALLVPQSVVSSATLIALRLAACLIGVLTGVLATEQQHAPKQLSPSAKVVDTNVLIDGRIAGVVESGFLSGTLIVPEFVLHELQSIADSSDSAKRARGRRGLDLVERLKQAPSVQLEIEHRDFPSALDVDLKLIELARLRRASLVTNDFNLNKLAHVQGISVLNINDLAGALRPIVLPGETMRILIAKEGKEPGQGVGYLDDGTIVVVENGKRSMSRSIEVTVTSVIQTSAGKMIFAKA